jgi:hypothetical protein
MWHARKIKGKGELHTVFLMGNPERKRLLGTRVLK